MRATVIAWIMGGWELVLICSIVLILIARQSFQRVTRNSPSSSALEKCNLGLWIAQGFGVGLVPFGPGTLGSVVGVLWFALLLSSGSVWVLAAGTIGGLALSVWLCGAAEKVLQQ